MGAQKFAIQYGKQHISHESEQPEYHKEYDIKTANPVTAKVYLIDKKYFSVIMKWKYTG